MRFKPGHITINEFHTSRLIYNKNEHSYYYIVLNYSNWSNDLLIIDLDQNNDLYTDIFQELTTKQNQFFRMYHK